MRNYVLAISCLAITLSAPLVLAKGSPEEMFARVDTNNDGYLTKEEMKAAHEKRRKNKPSHKKGKGAGFFDKADSNGDGKLSKAEASAMHSMRVAERNRRRAEKGNQ